MTERNYNIVEPIHMDTQVAKINHMIKEVDHLAKSLEHRYLFLGKLGSDYIFKCCPLVGEVRK